MNPFFMIILVIALCGCGSRNGVDDNDESARPETSLYDEHEGLNLPEEMQREFGLQFATLTDTNAIPESAIVRGAKEDFTYVRNGKYLVRTPLEELTASAQIVTHGVKDLWLIELLAIRGGEPCCR